MSSSSNLVNQSTTNSRWSLFPSIMSFHLHRTLPHTVFFSSTEDEEKKCGDGGETERKPFEDPLLQRAKIQEEKEKKMETKIQNKKKGKRSEPPPLPPPKAKRSEKTGAAAAAEAARAVESPGQRWGQKGPKMSIC
jgi:hypothetical protein